MQLTRYADYALRVLLYLGKKDGDVCPIRDISTAYGISHNHLTKVVHELGRAGFISSVRGRFGGVLLSRDAAQINLGDVFRAMEKQDGLAECGTCPIAGGCGLQNVLDEALAAFMGVLNRYSLRDMLDQSPHIEQMLDMLSANN